MNNFSELQATKINLPVVILVEPVFDTQSPEIMVTVAHQVLFSGQLTQPVTLSCCVDLLSQFEISIELINKDDHKDHTSAVVIAQLIIDSHDLVPQWSHLAHYSNDKNYNLPTTHLGFNGSWKLDINEPFYRWWHRVTGQGWLLLPDLT
jgi:hypothetical protein